MRLLSTVSLTFKVFSLVALTTPIWANSIPTDPVPAPIETAEEATPPVHVATPIIPIQETFSPLAPVDLSKYVKVAVIQWNPVQSAPVGAPAEDQLAYLQNNREEMAARIEEAARNGATYISLSEFAVVGYPDIPELPPEEDEFRNREDIKGFVDPIPGKSTKYFSEIAKKNKVWIQFGMAEVETVTDKYFNTAVVINSSGVIVASFRKQTLYQLEFNFLSAGDKLVSFNSPMGTIGLVVCADIYNEEVLRGYKKLGVDVLSLSTSWAEMNTGMETFTWAARRMGTYVLAANQTYFPDSGVINPDGTTQSHIRQSKDGIAYGYIKSRLTRK